ncbi:hypothetical protein ACI8AF_17665 [Blastococcus sp. SYSU D00669]
MAHTPATADRSTSQPSREPTRWVGLVVFAGVMMAMLGFFQAIAGLAAIVNDDYYQTAPDRLVLVDDYTTWGWIHLLLGIVIFLAGVGVMSGNAVARAVGVVLAVLSAVSALAFSPAQPVWAAIVVAVDVLVIYALTVHGGEMERV